VEQQVICKTYLDQEKTAAFVRAIYQQYWFTMFIGKVESIVCMYVCLTAALLDDLPINAPVGDVADIAEGSVRAPLYLHKAFTIEYNKDRVSQSPQGKGAAGVIVRMSFWY
jgi:transmembrane 9 superfamily protein 3